MRVCSSARQIQIASSLVWPLARAAAQHPPNLPAAATRRTTPHPIHAIGDFSDPTSVRKPVLEKKNGTGATGTKLAI
jgi:hypothetical protein